MALIVSKAELVQMAWNGQDEEATNIICDASIKFYQSAPSKEGLPEVSAKIKPLRGNLHLVPEELKATFEYVADLQDQWLNDSATERTVLAGTLHHYSVVRSEDGEWAAEVSAPVVGPRAYDFAFVLTNPYDLNKDWKTNLVFIADEERLDRQFEIIADRMDISVHELAIATLAHCFTTAAKRYWALDNNKEASINIHGSNNDQEVGPQYFIELAKVIAPKAGISLG